MAVDLNYALANALLDRYDTEFPAGSVLELRSGAPAGAEAAAGGNLLCSITTPATPWAAAVDGAKAKQGTWSGSAADTGTIGHYRFRNAASTRIEEGTVGITGSGADVIIADVPDLDVVFTQSITISTFTKTL